MNTNEEMEAEEMASVSMKVFEEWESRSTLLPDSWESIDARFEVNVVQLLGGIRGVTMNIVVNDIPTSIEEILAYYLALGMGVTLVRQDRAGGPLN